jgi:DNA-binding SARP family transcriptional activator
MSTLRIYLFGSIRLQMGDNPTEIRISRGVQELFVYLLLDRHRTHSRELLAGKIWANSSQERARDCLNTALWRLRRILEPENHMHGTYLITTSDGEIGFNFNSDYWLDVEAFQSSVGKIGQAALAQRRVFEIAELEKSLSLYVGDLLEGLYIDWILHEREHLRLIYLDSLAFLLACWKEQGNFARSLGFGLRILALDPLREDVHREVIRLYLANGQRALALRQYALCQNILNTELGISPMEETKALYSKIMNEADPGERAIGNNLPAARPLGASLNDLNQTVHSFDILQNELHHIVHDMNDALKPNQ